MQLNATDYARTAYVYDDFDRLKCVIQPEGVALGQSFGEGDAFFDKWVFAYRYDGRGRVVESHVPGGGWTHRVYDQLDRLAMEQTELQRQQNAWRFEKYDALGRSI